jgi:predicted DNA-binding antitoxin AbrB/MazE fold protein
METLLVNATYANGVLKPDQPLPLAEHQRVKVSIHAAPKERPSVDEAVARVKATAGMLGWAGDAETIERLAMDPEFGIEESP